MINRHIIKCHIARAHLEYNNSVWAPYKRCDIEKLEKCKNEQQKCYRLLLNYHYIYQMTTTQEEIAVNYW